MGYIAEFDGNNKDFINLKLFQGKQSSIGINKSYNLRDRSVVSDISMNVNYERQGNPDVVKQANIEHQDLPNFGMFKKESSFNPAKQFMQERGSFMKQNSSVIKRGNSTIRQPSLLKRGSSIIKPKVERNKSIESQSKKLPARVPVLTPRLSRQESLDMADKWVRTQHNNFQATGYNYNNEVEKMLEEEEDETPKVHIQPIRRQVDHLPPTKAKKSPKALKNDTSKAGINIRRHRKKSKKQLEVLDSHFDIDKEWSLELVEELATDLNLEKDQVYKWAWDKRKRLRKKMERDSKSSKSKKTNKRKRNS